MIRFKSNLPSVDREKILEDRDGLAQRIAAMLALFPSRKAAAIAAGKTQETITAWSRGEGLAQFLALAAVAAEAGVSLDWLAFGGEGARPEGPDEPGGARESMPHISGDCARLAELAVATTLAWLEENDIDLTGPMLARLIAKSFRALMDAPDLAAMSAAGQTAVVTRMLDDGLDLLRAPRDGDAPL